MFFIFKFDVIATVDTDGNGNLSFEEFIKIATSLIDASPSLQKLEQAFKNFDQNFEYLAKISIFPPKTPLPHEETSPNTTKKTTN